MAKNTVNPVLAEIKQGDHVVIYRCYRAPAAANATVIAATSRKFLAQTDSRFYTISKVTGNEITKKDPARNHVLVTDGKLATW